MINDMSIEISNDKDLIIEKIDEVSSVAEEILEKVSKFEI